MITERIFPTSENEFSDALSARLKGKRSVVVHAGHFLLHVDKCSGVAVASIADEMAEDSNLKREVAHFPLLSWTLACRALQKLQDIDVYLLVIVNDWQYVPDPVLRESFYEGRTTLPDSFVDVARTMLPRAEFLRPRGTGGLDSGTPFFSERSLRNRYNRRLQGMLRDGKLPGDVSIDGDQQRPACHLDDIAGGSVEVYCPGKDADCSKEIAEVIDETHSLTNCDAFVNFFPAVCRDFVELGSELPIRLFGTGVGLIINVALPATRVFSVQDLVQESEITVHQLGGTGDERQLQSGRA